MLCRITNDQRAPRIYFDRNLKQVVVLPGKSVVADLDPATYEDARALALVHRGPQVEAVEQPSKPEPCLIGSDAVSREMEDADEQIAMSREAAADDDPPIELPARRRGRPRKAVR